MQAGGEKVLNTVGKRLTGSKAKGKKKRNLTSVPGGSKFVEEDAQGMWKDQKKRKVENREIRLKRGELGKTVLNAKYTESKESLVRGISRGNLAGESFLEELSKKKRGRRYRSEESKLPRKSRKQ